MSLYTDEEISTAWRSGRSSLDSASSRTGSRPDRLRPARTEQSSTWTRVALADNSYRAGRLACSSRLPVC